VKPRSAHAFVDHSAQGYGRLVRVTAKSPGGSDLQPVVYVVAVEDPAKAIEIIRAEVQVNANIEVLGRASEELPML
jgi:hypothetical protein